MSELGYRIKEKRNYRINNKEKIKEIRKQKYICDCGAFLNIVGRTKHWKSNKHKLYIKKWINNLINNNNDTNNNNNNINDNNNI